MPGVQFSFVRPLTFFRRAVESCAVAAAGQCTPEQQPEGGSKLQQPPAKRARRHSGEVAAERSGAKWGPEVPCEDPAANEPQPLSMSCEPPNVQEESGGEEDSFWLGQGFDEP